MGNNSVELFVQMQLYNYLRNIILMKVFKELQIKFINTAESHDVVDVVNIPCRMISVAIQFQIKHNARSGFVFVIIRDRLTVLHIWF